MTMPLKRGLFRLILVIGICPVAGPAQIGIEKSVPRHLADGEEFRISTDQLISHGKKLFEAVWTIQEGGGRPRSKGTGGPLSNLFAPLVFPRNFNRISAPDANSCFGC